MTPKKPHKRGPVRCIETGIVYESASAACHALGRTLCAMSNHLAGRAPHVKNLHFERVQVEARAVTIPEN